MRWSELSHGKCTHSLAITGLAGVIKYNPELTWGSAMPSAVMFHIGGLSKNDAQGVMFVHLWSGGDGDVVCTCACAYICRCLCACVCARALGNRVSALLPHNNPVWP